MYDVFMTLLEDYMFILSAYCWIKYMNILTGEGCYSKTDTAL